MSGEFFFLEQIALGGFIASIAIFVVIGFAGIWTLISPGARIKDQSEGTG